MANQIEKNIKSYTGSTAKAKQSLQAAQGSETSLLTKGLQGLRKAGAPVRKQLGALVQLPGQMIKTAQSQNTQKKVQSKANRNKLKSAAKKAIGGKY